MAEKHFIVCDNCGIEKERDGMSDEGRIDEKGRAIGGWIGINLLGHAYCGLDACSAKCAKKIIDEQRVGD